MAASAGNTIDPIHQFQVNKIVPINLFGQDVSFSNASLFMAIVVLSILGLMVYGTRKQALIPGRLQAAAEMSYEFVAATVRGSAGQEGMRFFPLVFSLFMFVLFSNLIGLVPYTFTVTSQILVTFAFAALVILTVLLYGFWRHGLHFLRLFVPSGVSPALLWFVMLIEGISDFFIRATVRQHVGRSHHVESFRWIRRHADGCRSVGCACAAATSRRCRSHRARASRRGAAGVRIRHPHLRLS